MKNCRTFGITFRFFTKLTLPALFAFDFSRKCKDGKFRALNFQQEYYIGFLQIVKGKTVFEFLVKFGDALNSSY